MSQATPNVPTRAVNFGGLLARSARRSVGTARKFTPYRATPASRRIRNVGGDPSDNVETENVDFSVFTKTSFTAYKVTPFYNFSYNKKHLKFYGRTLGAFLQAETHRGLGVDAGEIADTATFSIKKGIKQGEDDAECIEIILKAESKNGGENTVVLRALLCCVNLSSDVAPAAEHFTALPLMLVKGGVALTRTLHAWLQRQFDCSISALRLSPVLLSWMVAMWSGAVDKGSQRGVKPVQLVYEVPPQVEGLRTITMTIDAQNAHTLWNGIRAGDSDSFKEEEVTTFIKALEAHFYHFFEIHLSRLKLSQIGTAIALVGSKGKIKIFSPFHVLHILAHLTEICSEQLLEI